jgi:acetyl-CoA synthetase
VRRPFSQDWDVFSDPERTHPREAPPIAWWPDDAVTKGSNLFALQSELGLASYEALHRYSVDEREDFWSRVLDRLGIVFQTPPTRIVDLASGVKHPRWLPGAELEISRSCFTAPGEDTAIVYGRENGAIERVSYYRLDAEVDRFARALCTRGFEPKDGVALYMPMTPDCVIAYLGTVRAGCRVVSIADSFSADELHTRLEIAGARAVVTVSAYRRADREIALYPKVRDAVGRFDLPPTVIVIDPGELEGDDVAWPEFLEAGSDAETEPAFTADPYHVTNVLFSSGTTGEPKAIPWTQLTPLKAGMDAHFHQDVHPDDVVCWPTNIGWMMGPWLIYASLLNRATIALYEGAPTGNGFTEFVRAAAVTILGVVPSIVRHWRSAESVDAGAWSKVRLFSSTGEASSSEDYLWLMSRADYRAPVIEYLGGTEIGGGHLTGTVLQSASPATFTTAALGIDVVILDEDGHVVREGKMGELFLVPPALGLSQELLNRDHDSVYYDGCPTGPNGEVLRRHGDHIARLANGKFKAQGRADDTMNLGGIKVSSIELERVVNEHPLIGESAAVSVQPGGEGAERLVVYVVLEKTASPPEPPDIDELQSALAKKVAAELNPLFKIHEVVVVESLPRTASNKIMRRRLRADYGAKEAL